MIFAHAQAAREKESGGVYFGGRRYGVSFTIGILMARSPARGKFRALCRQRLQAGAGAEEDEPLRQMLFARRMLQVVCPV